MKYFCRNDLYKPKNCIWGPRLTEGIILNEEEWCRIKNHNWKPDESREKSPKIKKSQKFLQLKDATETANLRQPTETLKKEFSEKDEKTINRALRLIHENKSSTKQLLTATGLSAILEERNNQLNFNKQILAAAREKQEKEKAKFWKNFAELQKINQENYLKKDHIKREYRKILDNQIEEFQTKLKTKKVAIENENRLQKRKQRFIKLICQKEEQLKRQELMERKNAIQIYLHGESEIKKRKQQEEKDEIEKNKIFEDVAEFLKKETKKREKVVDSPLKILGIEKFKEIKQRTEIEMQKESDKIQAQKIEQDNLKNEEFVKILKRKEDALCKWKKEQLKSQEEIKKRLAEENVKREEESRERKKKSDFDLLWNEKEKERERKKKDKVRTDYEKQWKENEERKREERELGKPTSKNFDKENVEIIRFCDYVLERTKEKNRPMFPVLSAVQNVKLQRGILKRKTNIQHLESKVLLMN